MELADRRPEMTPMPRRRAGRWLLGSMVLCLAIIYLIWAAATGSTTYYLTVSELKAQGPANRAARVAGSVVPGSLRHLPREGQAHFSIADETGALSVTYAGAPPDMLRDGADTVLEGRYVAEDLFEADKIILQCPSKYEAAPGSGAAP